MNCQTTLPMGRAPALAGCAPRAWRHVSRNFLHSQFIGGNRPVLPPSPAFTIIELLVVISIMGLLTVIGLPALKGIGKSNVTASAERQLLDDIALARQRAIANRSPVYMVFVPTNIIFQTPPASQSESKVFTNLLGQQFTGYALVCLRQVGEQPGQQTPRYLSEWKSLPPGTFISVNKFNGNAQQSIASIQVGTNNGRAMLDVVYPFQPSPQPVPFPLATSTSMILPCIGFDYLGRLISQRDEIIPLSRGSIFYARDSSGQLIRGQIPDVIETPPGNWTNMWNFVHIDWLTGRARVEYQQVQ